HDWWWSSDIAGLLRLCGRGTQVLQPASKVLKFPVASLYSKDRGVFMAEGKSQPRGFLTLKAAVLIFFLPFYLITTPRNKPGADCLFMFWVCQSLVEDGDINIMNQSLAQIKESNDREALDSYVIPFSKYPLATSLVGIPFYVAAKGVSRVLNRPL